MLKRPESNVLPARGTGTIKGWQLNCAVAHQMRNSASHNSFASLASLRIGHYTAWMPEARHLNRFVHEYFAVIFGYISTSKFYSFLHEWEPPCLSSINERLLEGQPHISIKTPSILCCGQWKVRQLSFRFFLAHAIRYAIIISLLYVFAAILSTFLTHSLCINEFICACWISMGEIYYLSMNWWICFLINIESSETHKMVRKVTTVDGGVRAQG